ncbi:MAG: hypothetical protein FWE67_14700, partial [Planctomycetaceae bacterium]|nr:hypothetical protein [Planctomycetaceae bacterium]
SAGLIFILCIAANIVLYPAVGSMVSGNPKTENTDNLSAKLLQELKTFQDRYISNGTQNKAADSDKPASAPDIGGGPFAKFVGEEKSHIKAAAPAESEPDDAAKLYDKNIEEPIIEPLVKPDEK